MKSLADCVQPTLAMLDASLALHESGVYVCLSLLPESDTYPSLQHAVLTWASAKQATIEVVTEEHGVMNYVVLGGRNIARVHIPNADTVVVEEPRSVA